jgi:hypothetical protein
LSSIAVSAEQDNRDIRFVYIFVLFSRDLYHAVTRQRFSSYETRNVRENRGPQWLNHCRYMKGRVPDRWNDGTFGPFSQSSTPHPSPLLRLLASGQL